MIFKSRNKALGVLIVAMGLALGAVPALAQPASGGSSGGGADQGGTGAPGGGTGVPGAVASGHSAAGVGTSTVPRALQHRHHHRHHR